MDEAKREPATPRKQARARAEGVVAASPELPAAAGLLAFALALPLIGARIATACARCVKLALAAASAPDAALVGGELAASAWELAALLAGMLCAIALAAWLAGFVQIGPLFAARALAPDARRLAPFARLRGLFSPDTLEVAGFDALKLAALCAVLAYTLIANGRGLLALGRGDAAHARDALSVLGRALALRAGGTLLLLGVFDLVLRRLRVARKLRMSRSELAREHREQYGLPEQRERRRRAYAEAEAQTELAALDACSLLVLDSRFARVVGLAFDAGDPAQRAPRVVLKAQAALALRVQARATGLSLPIHDDALLCARLFVLELGETIPHAEYDAVAALFRAQSSGAQAS